MVGGGTVSARLVALLPEAVLLDDAPFSRVGTSVEAVQDMFDRALEKQVGGGGVRGACLAGSRL